MVGHNEFVVLSTNSFALWSGCPFAHRVKPRLSAPASDAEPVLGHVPQCGQSLSAEVVENFVEK
jgi:hypothetical protein